MAQALIIRGNRVVTPPGIRPAAVHIRDGVIAAVSAQNDFPPDWPVFDAGNSVVMPGLVDTHVHTNEPGRSDWEGFSAATRAAAAGGITTLVDMPLNSIPATTTVEALEAKRSAARANCWVDVGFWGGLVPGTTPQLRPLHDAGVLGFKCFLVPSGVDEFAHLTEADLRAALKELEALGALLAVHAELPGPIERALAAQRQCGCADPRKYSTFLHSRPREAENEAISLLIALLREIHWNGPRRSGSRTGLRMHIVHLSSADALPLLRAARAEGLPITAETCPHYLCLAAEDIPDGATEFKCAPPIRERENSEQLWAALKEDLIQMVVTDHSPCPPAMKQKESGDFLRAWGGISSLQLRLPLMWTAARQRGFHFEQLSKWLCTAPAALVGFEHRKGRIQPGCNADFVVWDPDKLVPVKPSDLHHRHKLTPYAGQTLYGVVEACFLRGQKIYSDGRFSDRPKGRLFSRESPGMDSAELLD